MNKFGAIKNNFSLNCKGRILSFADPIVMGILNLAPDSFYDGGIYTNEKQILLQVEKMLMEGAAVIDIGAESTRPGAALITETEEQDRLLPVLQLIIEKIPGTIISIDTYRASTAKMAIENGASIINDISGGEMDRKMFETISTLKVPYILMHMLGTPQNMQLNPQYSDVVTEVMNFFASRIIILKELGVNDIIIDPGFGFGKTPGNNYSLLSNLDYFKILDVPILAGLSRKSMICKILNVRPSEALNGTTALNMIALLNGANMLRVHDVKEAMEVVNLWKMVNKSLAANCQESVES